MTPHTEAWVKKEVKKIFAEFGCPNPYMPPPAVYGKAGAADFIECMWGQYIAVETKKIGNKQTELQKLFQAGVNRRGGIYLLIYETDFDRLRRVLKQMSINSHV